MMRDIEELCKSIHISFNHPKRRINNVMLLFVKFGAAGDIVILDFSILYFEHRFSERGSDHYVAKRGSFYGAHQDASWVGWGV